MKIPRQVKVTIFAITILSLSTFGLYLFLLRLGYLPPFSAIVCLNNCPATSNLHTPQQGNELLNYNQPIAQIIAPANIDKTKTSILIEKSKYRLTLYHNQQPIKSYPVVFGKNPVADKLREGDFSTPEGIFTIKDLYNHPNWSKFLWLDYPNQTSWQKHFQSKIGGKIKWSDSIGSEVGIHGVPAGGDNLIDNRSNWTWGCISLKNQDVDEIYQIVQEGTKVEIIP
ncbi:L,D-transpeptidase family protein [Limnofasciculus baicalensis]|uniref:L,D-transpeptidase n=1 Tax=Limnofasciculus baicalensis BBK-W-15 TaxID=2699891 RepID=A0AAE3KPC7_9CYAN|nr:L,D-transpeptidase [Limnofasciculus baicalensis]MCP2731415.1 L,D-transpeptidase [Limnofasciculus baicalensis BBK-W-15]